jgi:hypothetical protein
MIWFDASAFGRDRHQMRAHGGNVLISRLRKATCGCYHPQEFSHHRYVFLHAEKWRQQGGRRQQNAKAALNDNAKNG